MANMPGVTLVVQPTAKLHHILSTLPCDFSWSRGWVKTRQVRLLTINSGEFSIAPGGHLLVDVPESKLRGVVIFHEGDFFEILDQTGRRVKRNYILCEACYKLTGRLIGDHEWECTECGDKWK